MARWLTLHKRRETAGVSSLSRARILEPYTGIAWYQRHRRLCLWGLGIICSIYGYLWAVAAQYVLTILLGPMLLVVALLVWLLPETERVPRHWLEGGLFAYLIALLCWPNYIALAFPGLPWITLIRLIGMPLVILLLICLSMSRQLRSQTLDILNACPVLWRCVFAFAVISMLSIAMSQHIGDSLSKFVAAQVNWIAMFFISCIVFAKPGNVQRLAVTLWGVVIFVCLIGIWEWRLGRLPWVGHIPSFLAIDDPSVQRALGVQSRAGTNIYRVHSKFPTSLGLAEYLALTAPFLMHFAATAQRLWMRLAAVATLLLSIFVIHLTDSRLGAIGFFLSIALYLFVWAVIKWRNDKSGVLGAMITLSYPVLFVLMVAATLIVGRLRVEIWGDGSQQASTETRKIMYEQGMMMILKNPLGYGIGQAGETLGYRNGDGILTIDTYYIAVGLEFGVIGFILYYGMHAYAMVKSAHLAYYRNDGDFQWLGPLAIAIFNFIVIKSVFSSEDNHPLVFIFLGVVAALAYRASTAKVAGAELPQARIGEQAPRRSHALARFMKQ
jgi:hypothetical protein